MFLQFLKILLLLLRTTNLEKVIYEDNKIDKRIKYLNKSVPRKCINNLCNKEFPNCKRKCDLCGSAVVTASVS